MKKYLFLHPSFLSFLSELIYTLIANECHKIRSITYKWLETEWDYYLKINL
jgi:hypothetical protein